MDREALNKKTVAELKEMAKNLPDVKGISAMKKSDLVELLAGSGRSRDETAVGGAGARPAESKAARPVEKSEIKSRIKALKAEKQEALEHNDRARSRRCNRQIHYYKRQLRKMAGAKSSR